MFTAHNGALVNLDGSTGFNIEVLDGDGKVVDSVGMNALDCSAYPIEGYIVLSAVRTAVYMAHIWMSDFGEGRERQAYMAHVKDFRRKLDDFVEGR